MLTLLQGTSVVSYYTGELQVHMREDIRRLHMLASGQMPLDMLTVEEYRQILQEAPIQGTNFYLSQTKENLIAELPRMPVKLLRDAASARLYAQLTIPLYHDETTFRLYHVLPVPVRHPNVPGVQEMVILKDRYIAVSGNQFILVNPSEHLYDCQRISNRIQIFMEESHLCATPQAIIAFQTTGNFSSCVASLFYGKKTDQTLPSTCKTEIQLNTNNQFRHLKGNV